MSDMPTSKSNPCAVSARGFQELDVWTTAMGAIADATDAAQKAAQAVVAFGGGAAPSNDAAPIKDWGRLQLQYLSIVVVILIVVVIVVVVVVGQ